MKKCLAMLLAVVMAVSLLPGTARATETSGQCGENVTWSFSGGVLTIEGTGPMKKYYGWNWVNAWNWRSPWSDFREQIHTVKIGDGVTAIGQAAFYDCVNLTNVTIPDSVTAIEDGAFENCSGLTGVTIPDSVTVIGEWVFSGCSSLTGIIIPDSVTSIEGFAFNGCSSLTSMTIPDGIPAIEMGTFGRCVNLTSVAIPDSVAYIGFNAFYGCVSLTGITIPDSVTYIGKNAFAECGLTSVTIPDSVTDIERNAFESCSNLTGVTISNSVTFIEDWTFARSGLTSVTIPDGVAVIGPSAFSGCGSLTDITIPVSVAAIEEWAFEFCDGLTDVYYGGSEDQWEQIDIENVYHANDPLLNANIHYNSAAGSGTPAPRYCGENVTWSWSGGVLAIEGTGPMDNYDYLEMPWAYCRDHGLIHAVKIGDGVTGIGDRAFESCYDLTSVDIPDSVTSIGEWAFARCGSLTGVVIPDGVAAIGECAFWFCGGLTSVTIPDSVTRIEDEAFAGCENLKDVYYSGYSVEWDKISIEEGNEPLTAANIHYHTRRASGSCGENLSWVFDNGVLTIEGTGPMEDYSGSWKPWQSYCKDKIQSIVIGEGVTCIGERAFAECQVLTSVTIPASVTSIGTEAFRNCRSLTEAAIPDSVAAIGDRAFMLCNSLTEVTVPESVTAIGTGAFKECEKLTGIHVAGGNPAYSSVDGVLFDAGQTLLHTYPAGKSGSSYDIPDSVTDINAFAFVRCVSLTDVTVPEGVTAIGRNAFQSCENLVSMTIPVSVTAIGVEAFSSVGSLTDVYYGGSENQWEQISVSHSNIALLGADIHCAVASPAPSFTDVPEGEYYAGAVAWAVENGVTTGTTDTTFSPDELCTVQQILTFLWRAEGKPAANPSPITVPAAYQRAVDWAYEKHMIDYRVIPGAYCTRAEVVTYIWQACGSPDAVTESGFTDVSSGMGWTVAKAVDWAVENGITNGYPDGAFRPGNTCSRGEIVTFLHRACVPEVRVK